MGWFDGISTRTPTTSSSFTSTTLPAPIDVAEEVRGRALSVR
jgi:hypothetical protein